MRLFRRKSLKKRAQEAQEFLEVEARRRLQNGASFYALSLSGYLDLPDLTQEEREAIIDKFLFRVGGLLPNDQNRISDTQRELREARNSISTFGKTGCLENAVFANCVNVSAPLFNLVRASLIIEIFADQDGIHPSLVEFFIFYCLGFSSDPVVAHDCARRVASLRHTPGLTEDERRQFARQMVSRSIATTYPIRTAYEIFCET